MAHFSEKAAEERKAKRLASILAERADVFKQFRNGGWGISCWVESSTSGSYRMPDNTPERTSYLIKMPGARGVLIHSWAQVLRMLKGVGQ